MVEFVVDELKFIDDRVQIQFEEGHLGDNGVQFFKFGSHDVAFTLKGLNHGFYTNQHDVESSGDPA